MRIFLNFFLVSFFVFFLGQEIYGQSTTKLNLGAYYFDGWTSGSSHITLALRRDYSDRKPIWGWTTSTQKIVDQQINSASKAGLSFFSFCWYYDGKSKIDSINRALMFYKRSEYLNRLDYCLMVANHYGFLIGPKSWSIVKKEWLKHFDSPNYLKVDGKPLIIFYSLGTLISEFGSVINVREAFNDLRAEAINGGLKGVAVALCVSPYGPDINQAEACGIDILTGYNYHSEGFRGGNKNVSIDSMQKVEAVVWDKFRKLSNLKYIPVSTLNWDPRPWANAKNGYLNSPHFTGYSEKSVFNSVLGLSRWIKQNTASTTKENIGILYAWNENGEGAYLTPTIKGPNLLNGVKKAIDKSSNKIK